LRKTEGLSAGLSVRATDEACIYLKHPLIAGERSRLLPEVLKSSFCGRYSGRWNDPHSDAGVAWGAIQSALREQGEGSSDDNG
jgi:nitric oxide reductase NorQ protein